MLLKEGRGLLSHVRLILKCNIQLKHKLIINNDVTALYALYGYPSMEMVGLKLLAIPVLIEKSKPTS